MRIFFVFCFAMLVCVQGECVKREHIVTHNAVLATIRGKVLTVVDVQSKLDMLFYQQFPQFSESVDAKFEFYKTNWRRVLEDLVNRQLILLFAENKNFQVSSGDLREEMEEPEL